jgi:hypothetical protein
MDVSYIGAAPALVRLRDEHRDHPDLTAHRLDAARLRRERSHVRRLLWRLRTRPGSGVLAPIPSRPPDNSTPQRFRLT